MLGLLDKVRLDPGSNLEPKGEGRAIADYFSCGCGTLCSLRGELHPIPSRCLEGLRSPCGVWVVFHPGGLTSQEGISLLLKEVVVENWWCLRTISWLFPRWHPGLCHFCGCADVWQPLIAGDVLVASRWDCSKLLPESLQNEFTEWDMEVKAHFVHKPAAAHISLNPSLSLHQINILIMMPDKVCYKIPWYKSTFTGTFSDICQQVDADDALCHLKEAYVSSVPGASGVPAASSLHILFFSE